ncbi:MAG: DUF115 domain-containing protein [Phycisphaerae bacterium]|nr:DUF115 domain-containing protein [Phycisphaerae bacterium]
MTTPYNPQSGPDSFPLAAPTLSRNLAALRASSPATARRVAEAQPHPGLRWVEADDGCLSATLEVEGVERQLASLRQPRQEGRRLADQVDPLSAGAVIINGFGLGYHAEAMAGRMRRAGVVLVFEPDVSLLRGVLERIDCSEWIAEANIAVFTDAEDSAAVASVCAGIEPVLAMGVRILDHPPSRARLGPLAAEFGRTFAGQLRAVRLQLVTSLLQVETTIRNVLMNVDHYAASAGVADLKGVAAGAPAVVVSAGPSLERNIRALARPGVRERVVIVAVQTVLKKLLAHGIRPHFVTALDYHEISRRFYEGLTEADVEGVTLVAEAKANPAILGSFPGVIRCPRDPILHGLIGDGVDRGELVSGATVAHLAYGLARHLGCDPVILVGQDLGFTDGQYYSAGAAIHDVWAGELSEFNSLEMMEWQRIARFGPALQRATDVFGRPIFTDEQMLTYRLQFERLFEADERKGLRTIDATEGGVSKRHTEPMTLEHALDLAVAPLSLPECGRPGRADGATRERLVERLRGVRRDAGRMAALSRQTADLLRVMEEHHADQERVNRLIGRVDSIRDEVEGLEPAYGLVHFLNQTGTLKRFKADRAIDVAPDLGALEKQKRQIERDIVNVEWLAQAADQVGSLLDDAARALGGAPKITRDPAPPVLPSDEEDGADPSRRRRVAAVIVVDHRGDAFGLGRDAGAEVASGEPGLRLTLARLRRCRELDSIVLISDDESATRRLAGDLASGAGPAVRVVGADLSGWRRRARCVRGARLWSRWCWRGGLASMTVHDEALDPVLVAGALADAGLDAVVPVGADWCLVDAVLVDGVVSRYRERPDRHRVTFTLAPPGLAACAVDLSVVRELARGQASVGVFATLGGLLGYNPIAPRLDPIAKGECVHVSPRVRDLQERVVADDAHGRRLVRGAIEALGEGWVSARADEIAGAVERSGRGGPARLIHLEITTRRARSIGPDLAEAPGARSDMDEAHLGEIMAPLLTPGDRVGVTLGGAGDPLLHPRWRAIVERLLSMGVAGVHLRTDLSGEQVDPGALLDAGLDVISVDVLADTAAAYAALTGTDRFGVVTHNLGALVERRGEPTLGLHPTWIVPRLTRCDGAYPDQESFFVRWLVGVGAALVDPMPAGRAPGPERIATLPTPATLAAREAREVVRVLSDATVVRRAMLGGEGVPAGPLRVA